MNLIDNLFSYSYSGPDLSGLSNHRNFRNRISDSVQLAISSGLTIFLTRTTELEIENSTFAKEQFPDIFVFDSKNNWIRSYHFVENSVYKLSLSKLIEISVVKLLPSTINSIIQILGYNKDLSRRLYSSTNPNLLIWGMIQ